MEKPHLKLIFLGGPSCTWKAKESPIFKVIVAGFRGFQLPKQK